MMPAFRYAAPILETFPTVVGGVLVGSVRVDGPSDDLTARYINEQQQVIKRIGDTPLSAIGSLAAWRAAFRKFNVDPTKYRSAAEALLRRLTKKGDIPSINPLVDIGNLISIRYGLPVAIFDVSSLQGDTLTVQFATGKEQFTNLGADAPEHPETGEVIFADEAGAVFARRWCWRQSNASAANTNTTNVIVTVEAHHEEGLADVDRASEDLHELLSTYANFVGESGTVSVRSPSFPA
jgi:DNA/RNA-binding domain of Phe-tRNA-synthetase-like protein